MIARMHHTRHLLFLCITGLLFLCGTARAQKVIYQHQYPTAGATKITLTSPFAKGPAYGFLAIRVSINNDTPRDREWRLSFKITNIIENSSTFRIAVKAGQEIEQDILVPVPWQLHPSSYQQQNIRIFADALPTVTSSNSEQFEDNWPNIVISKKLAAKNLTQLSNHLTDQVNNKKKHSSHTTPTQDFASTFDDNILPDNWRAYIGYDALMISAEEWTALRPAVQKAILEWNRFGGTLQIYTAPSDRRISFLTLGFDRHPALNNVSRKKHSYGYIELHGWDGANIKLAQTYNTLKNVGWRRTDFRDAYTRQWGLQKEFGEKSFNPMLVVLILIIFSIVVGPINLFVFAKQGRRQRLFITTPIISLIASLLVMALIVFKDGFGGDGRRLLVMNLEGGVNEKRAYLTQEQISRTGVLLGNQFQLQDSTFIAPVQLSDSQWSHQMNYSNRAAFSFVNNRLEGDWFKNRSEQAQVIQSVQATRSRIELISAAKPNQAPVLFSSLEFSLDQLFYVGDGGRIWKANTENIVPGSKIILEASTKDALNKWWLPLTDPLSSAYQKKNGDQSFRRKTRNLTAIGGRFFASSKDPKVGFIDTLDSIKWTDSRAMIFGPAVKMTAPTKTTTSTSPAK